MASSAPNSSKLLTQITAASSYAITSVLILLFNKIILTTYSFKYPFTMALSHMLVGLILLHVMKTLKIIHYAPFDINLAKKALPVSLCFIGNCVLGMVALRGTNIPMFATLRRLTIMMVVLCEVLILKKKQTSLIVISVAIMITGSFIGGWGDLEFDLFGYSMVLLNNLVTALNLVFIKKTLMDTKLAADTFGVLYYNSLLSIPLLLVFSVISGETYGLMTSFPYLYDSKFQLSFLLSALMSFCMNYSTYWCTEVNSALTTSVTGQVKNVLSSFVSLSLFATSGVGVAPTPLLVAGLSVGLSGSFLYAYAIYKQDQLRQKNAREKKAELERSQKDVHVITEVQPLLSHSASGMITSPNHAHAVNGNGSSTMNGHGDHSSTTPLSSKNKQQQLQSPHHDVDASLTHLTGGVVNGIHSTQRHNAYSNGNGSGIEMSESDNAHAKLLRLEAGQRSPMPRDANGSMPLQFPSFPSQTPRGTSANGIGSVGVGGGGIMNNSGVPSSPNPLHPYNNPHKSKPM